ncbi:hypothetical protein H2198_002068 [Neophaeococcomyces mojaviensis]|uniref:Uncharacterized protein n=1 Tax=Neophaeococcomyces mojaviensis TaxID=3383035 RepID=A0ACC3AFW7_9EURO|nr:hypothetical protein H2198_002068 [Knufia sp. JES_112]
MAKTSSQRPKRCREVQTPVSCIAIEPPQKRPRSSLTDPASPELVSSISASQRSFVGRWTEEQDWPQDFFQQDGVKCLLARKKLPSPRSEGSYIASPTSSDPKPPEEKSTPYQYPAYPTLLETQGNSYMREHELGVTEEGEQLCRMLLWREQPTPTDTIFRDDVFRATCNRLQGTNEARIIKDLTPLIVPSAEPLATLGAKHLDIVVESVSECWDCCIPVIRPRPQPDYALGFARSAFTDDQLTKLQPFIGEPSDLSYFMATYYMHFPFLTCEVKSFDVGFAVPDRQNAHSMTVAMRGIVELFRRVRREQELHRQILGFSFSHDHDSVRIWGHYPVINKDKTTFWRHLIRKFDFTETNGAEKWVAYTFTMNVYDMWVTPHFRMICSAIDDLPFQQHSAAS